MTTISVDLMGGDHGPKVIIPGAALALKRHPSIRFHLFGLQDECLSILDQHPALKAASEFHHCEMAIQMDAHESTCSIISIRFITR